MSLLAKRSIVKEDKSNIITLGAIAKEMKLPVKLVGVGEKIEDLKEFNSEEFIDAIFN